MILPIKKTLNKQTYLYTFESINSAYTCVIYIYIFSNQSILKPMYKCLLLLTRVNITDACIIQRKDTKSIVRDTTALKWRHEMVIEIVVLS